MQPRLATRRLSHLSAGLVAVLVGGCGWSSHDEITLQPTGTSVTKADPPKADRNALPPADDPLGASTASVVYLEQNWSPELSTQFYFTSEGSQILPYEWFLALEQADNETPFRDPKNVLKLRYLPQKPGPMNPDGLPVGFVKDNGRDRAWLGFTCATCHTGEVRYKNVSYRVDGAPSLGDINAFLHTLVDALKATRADSPKFDRFAKAVLGEQDGKIARAGLSAELGKVIERRIGYNVRNFPEGQKAGYGRIDAFGSILNEVYHHAVKAKDLKDDKTNTEPADAPTSIPFLWDTPQHDLLQWNGSAGNGGPGNIGSLGRNVGEVLGVFGDFEIPENPGPFGYSSSVQVQKLRELEDWVTTLWSPLWPNEFPSIDSAKKTAGRTLFENNCLSCHKDIDRTDPKRKVVAQMISAGTDPRMADNFMNRKGKSGKLEGSWSQFLPLVGEKIGAESGAGSMLKNAVVGTIVGSPFRPPVDELTQIDLDARRRAANAVGAQAAPAPPQGPKYKARPLNGIWATAPYLHNGSVPSLADLLKPAKDRPKSFSVGSAEFDPAAVGYKQDAKGVYTFRVVDDAGKPIPGNSNAGHEYGGSLNDEQRSQLLEYLKSL